MRFTISHINSNNDATNIYDVPAIPMIANIPVNITTTLASKKQIKTPMSKKFFIVIIHAHYHYQHNVNTLT